MFPIQMEELGEDMPIEALRNVVGRSYIIDMIVAGSPFVAALKF